MINLNPSLICRNFTLLHGYLNRLLGLVKDFCGVVSEEAIVLNTALVYELLDEIMVSLLRITIWIKS